MQQNFYLSDSLVNGKPEDWKRNSSVYKEKLNFKIEIEFWDQVSSAKNAIFTTLYLYA